MNQVRDIHAAARSASIEKNRVLFYESQLRDVFTAAGVDPMSRHYDDRRIELLRKIDQLFTVEKVAVPEIRRRLTRGAPGARKGLRVMAVASGKGGVGKTTISINLSVALARRGLRVLLFDADLGLANVHVYTGLNPRGTIVDVISGRSSLDEVVMHGFGGVHVVCGDSGIAKMADLGTRMTDYLGRELEGLADRFDVILIDTAAGISTQVIDFLRVADQVVVVATPNLAATLDAYSLIKIARQNRVAAQTDLLINQVRDRTHSGEIYQKIRRCAEQFLGCTPGYLGYLLRDDQVETSHAQRQPLVTCFPASTNARLFRDIAATVKAPKSATTKKKLHRPKPTVSIDA